NRTRDEVKNGVPAAPTSEAARAAAANSLSAAWNSYVSTLPAAKRGQGAASAATPDNGKVRQEVDKDTMLKALPQARVLCALADHGAVLLANDLKGDFEALIGPHRNEYPFASGGTGIDTAQFLTLLQQLQALDQNSRELLAGLEGGKAF